MVPGSSSDVVPKTKSVRIRGQVSGHEFSFIDVLCTCVTAMRFRVHDFVVMRNHIHLLIAVDETMSVEKAVLSFRLFGPTKVVP